MTIRGFCLLLLSAASTATFLACTSGLTTQEAYAECRKIEPAADTSDVFKACVACFESCSDCERDPAGSATYACPGDAPDASTSTSSSSTGP